MSQLVSDHVKASNLIRLAGLLIPLQCLADYWLFKETMVMPQLIVVYISLFIQFAIAQIVRSSVQWIRWPLLILIALDLTIQSYAIIALLTIISFKELPSGDGLLWGPLAANLIFALVQNVLLLYSAYLLFVPTKKVDDEIFEAEDAMEV